MLPERRMWQAIWDLAVKMIDQPQDNFELLCSGGCRRYCSSGRCHGVPLRETIAAVLLITFQNREIMRKYMWSASPSNSVYSNNPATPVHTSPHLSSFNPSFPFTASPNAAFTSLLMP